MVGLELMVLTIPFISVTSLLRAVAASALLLALIVCHGDIRYGSTSNSSSSPAGETPLSAYDFINSIGLNTHLNYFDRIYGNFPLVERELKSVGVLHLRDGVHLQNSDYNRHALSGDGISSGTGDTFRRDPRPAQQSWPTQQHVAERGRSARGTGSNPLRDQMNWT